ncbi:MAG: leucine--tRNA ligase [Methylacidiphilales bacterium]|nr:leucine--tRNA ligase [Candidatus Methylacidiphilales bacterium]
MSLKKNENYQFDLIEKEVQEFWQHDKTFEVEVDNTKEKFYCLSMFPYPSGKLHIGHVRNYTLGDIIARYQRHQGKNVLQPIGWDAFGLPAENAARITNSSPEVWTKKNIAEMRTQLVRLGYGYDWRRELATCDPSYYKWEQWLFTKLIQDKTKGSPLRKSATVNWDPVDQTVLANEQVIEGKGWRSGAPVEKREIPSWYFKITDYAEELLVGLDQLTGWPKEVIQMQKNWIGKSEGATVRFLLNLPSPSTYPYLEVYTTRVDTLFGVSYLAIAKEHPLVSLSKYKNEIKDFIEICKLGSTSEKERATEQKLGFLIPDLHAIHPYTNTVIPIYIANYVLMEYGSGAIMAVPAHDERDYEFAIKYTLPIKEVISHATLPIPHAEEGVLINSEEFTGLPSKVAKNKIVQYLSAKNLGFVTTTYRLRDWGVSRQRYWGCPIPVCYSEDGAVHAQNTLPIVLPNKDFQTSNIQSLAHDKEFLHSCAPGLTRDPDTFDTFVESSWYYARFPSYDSANAMIDQRASYWLPVDQYVGGIEHAVLHLLYARFFNKLLRDQGLVQCDEPFISLLTQGMVLAPAYKHVTKDGGIEWVSPEDVITHKKGTDSYYTDKRDGSQILCVGKEKMSKSKKNGVDPDRLLDEYGADTLRLYITFAAPPEQTLEWSPAALEGCSKFLKKVYLLCRSHSEDLITLYQEFGIPKKTIVSPSATLNRICDATQKALYDYERKQFNTVVSSAMIIYNELVDHTIKQKDQTLVFFSIYTILLLLSPITPHVCQYLYRELGFGENILKAPWLQSSEYKNSSESVTMVIQVHGKKRGIYECPRDSTQSEVIALLTNHSQYSKLLTTQPKKIIFIPNKILNIIPSENEPHS